MSKLQKVKKDLYIMKRPKKSIHNVINDIDIINMYDRLLLVAMSVFEWKNLPDSVDEVYLEKTLLTHGELLFFKDKAMSENGEGDGEYLVLKYLRDSDKVDVYGNPTLRIAYSEIHSNYREKRTSKNSVIIKDNVLGTVFQNIILDFATHLVEVKAVIKMNLEHQKLPYIIAGSDETKAEIEEFFNQKVANKPYFIVKKGFIDNIKEALAMYSTNVEFIGEQLQDYYDAVWNEFMVMVGIGTNASPKRERLVASEVDSTNEQSEVFARSRLKSRQRACKLINAQFNLDISVEYDFGGGNNGTEYDNNIINTKKSSESKT